MPIVLSGRRHDVVSTRNGRDDDNVRFDYGTRGKHLHLSGKAARLFQAGQVVTVTRSRRRPCDCEAQVRVPWKGTLVPVKTWRPDRELGDGVVRVELRNGSHLHLKEAAWDKFLAGAISWAPEDELPHAASCESAIVPGAVSAECVTVPCLLCSKLVYLDGTGRGVKPHTCQKKTETVNHPQHYGGDTTYEAIKVIEAWELGFCLGNAVKYICRAGKKGSKKEDLLKALWYLQREIDRG